MAIEYWIFDISIDAVLPMPTIPTRPGNGEQHYPAWREIFRIAF